MPERDSWELLQPSWVDRMGATAWDPPNLPLFEGAPWPAAGAALANGAGQTALLAESSGFPYPLPLGWPNFIPGPAAPSQAAGPEMWAQVLNAFSRPASVRNPSTARSQPSSTTSPGADSLE